MTVMIPPATRTRVDDAATWWRTTPVAEVVYIGHHSIVLRVSAELAPLTAPGVGVMPNGAELSRAGEFETLRRSLDGRPSAVVDLTPWNAPARLALVPVDLALRPAPIAPPALARLQGALASAPFPGGLAGRAVRMLRSAAASLALAVDTGENASPHLLTLIGAGPGSTPTGDDVVLGVIAGLRARGDARGAAALGRSILPLLPRTTETSRYFLRHAIDGRFAEHVHEAVASLSAPERVDSVVEDAAKWGATSGIDLLAGLAAGVSAVPATSRRSAA